jgi:hypothetical protein
MGDYIHTETQQVMSQGQWRNHYKNTSLPRTWTAATLAGLKLEPVFETPKPTVDRMQTARRNGVKKDSKNNWVWAWVVEAKTQEQLDAESLMCSQHSLYAVNVTTSLLHPTGLKYLMHL